MKLIAKTLMSLEGVLAKELNDLGAQEVQPGKRAVYFEGDQKLLYRANLELRTAIRILKPIATFEIRNERDLYHQIRQIDWTEYMDLRDTLAIDAAVSSDILNHSQYAALKTKDAIVDQFRDRFGSRPNVDLRFPTLRINIHVLKTTVTVSLDSSGDSLHKRGYRAEIGMAPLNEVLAAGLIGLTGWQADCTFIDPMCGSGTLLIEAAFLAHNIPPQLHRKRFGFFRWKDFNKKLWEEVFESANDNIRPFEHEILGFDKQFKAIKMTEGNIFGAHLDGKITVKKKAFEQLQPPVENGILVMNPPYDERLEVKDVEALYKMIGDRLKQDYAGYEAWILSSNMDALKNVGLRPSKKFSVLNGPLTCKFQRYELYEGSRKAKKQTNDVQDS